MKNKIIFLLLLFTVSAFLCAQTVHNPNHQIYKDIDRWFVQGYITDFFPMIRPYPVLLIHKLLDQVIENGDEQAQEKAALYKNALSPESRFVHLGLSAFAQGNEEDYSLIISPFIEGVVHVNDMLNASFNLTLDALSDGLEGEKYTIPGTYSTYPDLEPDISNIGNFQVLQNWTSLAAVGTSDVYLQAGLSRTSFGPFFDNGVVAGPQAPRAGHFSFVYWDPLWSFEILFQVLTATDDYGLGRFPEKYNVIHNLSFRPFKNFELSIVQSIVYGNRFEPLYLVPFSYLFGVQTITGFLDNAIIGFNLNWRVIDTLQLKGQVFVDDFHFNNFLKGKPHFKAAGIIGVSWAPKNSVVSNIDFDYTAVMPYMYTHWHEPWYDRYNGLSDPDDPRSKPNGINSGKRIPNILNYTHYGRNIGPDLEPNSDRFSLRSNWGVIRNLDVNISSYLIRHGNASDGRDKLAGPWNGESGEYHDGSIFDSGSTDPWLDESVHPREDSQHNAYKEMNFLTQSVLDIKLGGTICVTWTIPAFFGTLKLMAGYGIQQSWNKDLIKNNNSLDHFWSIGGMFTW